ncbi:MAG TPA: hypothetical protein PLT86_06335 [Candidatus Latescibacteria bacterium]|nr:hypothetical protein [Candidatus Latescibacterota bacterium]
MAGLRDKLWLWGTGVNCLAKDYGFPESRMTIGGGLRELGIDQAMMCGFLPPTEEEYRDVAFCRNLLWEMSFDDGFQFERPLAPILALHEAHPNVRGVLLDDFSTTEISKGAQPDLLARMREALPPGMQLWIVTYSMSLDIPNLAEYLRYADGISFWVWHARQLPNLAEYVARSNDLCGNKPTVVGLYFHDFGENRALSAREMAAQVESGVRLLEDGACAGLCFLSSSIMDIGLESVEWTKQWVRGLG